ncbi:4-alpha-glucanotransferase [Streptomyces iranensis]|uniref:4-alpha-glucanotransferase n=1 Tax=Streptomyces iranensis TaxID=576784 RepID=A0A060ZUM7_9ACTN|nr:4-alpha-glucanotransferase [Streptomyces iranensis]MBP2065223.1 4-alpha-glucanotransferase [Streptomyces iranensis]CDR09820.1 4-alpha-glucanotransferase [Streptomyces iranensis]
MGRARLAELHGVATSYDPAPGRTVQVPEDTVVAVLAALGVDASTPRSVREALDRYDGRQRDRLLPPCVVVRPGKAPRLSLPEGTALRVCPEDGAPHPRGRAAAGALRADGPLKKGGAHESGALDGALTDGVLTGGLLTGGVLAGGVLMDGVFVDGATADGLLTALAALPPGAHTLLAEAPDGRRASAPLIVAPDRMPLSPVRSHGFLVQLYSLLSTRSWGMGDLGDLADLAAWSGRALGAGFVQINPLHAAVPGTPAAPTDPSPYRPSSRRFPDPVHLRIEDVPEYAHLRGRARERADQLLEAAAALRDSVLREGALIDRDAVWALKREALELVRTVPLSPGRRAAYCDFLAERGQALEDHALWCALAETHGPEWRAWPDGLADPRSAGTVRARAEHLDRTDFHCWLAWLTDTQLAAAQRAAREAGMGIGLVHDLAVGVHPSGADAWALQDVFASGMSIGAPPDAFNSRGQDWGLPPWRPDALAATGYAPYRDLLSGLLRHAGALRIDHVMGLFRLWWVPEGREPTEGCYVRYDAEAMLGALALEAHRAGAVVIGEDLGTVEPGVREELERRGVLGTSVMWFERNYNGTGAARPLAPEEWRADCLATVTTHDLPSTAARLTGDHVELRHRLGLLSRPLAEERAADAVEVAEWLGVLGRLGLLPEGPGDEEAAVKAVHRFLLRTPAKMVGVWLPDAVGDRRPQNLPGTWDQYPNWRLPIADAEGRPMSLEELVASPRLRALMDEVALLAPRGPTPHSHSGAPGGS